MSDTLEDLTDLVHWMKANGVLHLKDGSVEILLGTGHLPAPLPQAPTPIKKPALPPADDNLLFAHLEGYGDDVA